MRPSLIQLGGQTQGRSHAARMIGQNGLNAQSGSRSSRGSRSTADRPEHASRVRATAARTALLSRKTTDAFHPGRMLLSSAVRQHHPTKAIWAVASASAIAVNPCAPGGSAIQSRHLFRPTMGPLFFRAENVACPDRLWVRGLASMGPLFFRAENGPGPAHYPELSWLQWGRSFSERRTLDPHIWVFRPEASMGPLFFRAENRNRWTARSPIVMRFNGAALFQSGERR